MKKVLNLFLIVYFPILLISVIYNAIYLSSGSPRWDESAYILMGKYIYSLGKSGLWEAMRPPVLPLLLGGIWKIGLDPILWGRILISLINLASIYLVYIIGKDIFDNRTAVIAVIFLSLSPLFLSFSSFLMADIISAYLGLLAVYLALKNKWTAAGIMSAVSFLTRFIQGLIFACIVGVLFLFFRRYKSSEKIKFVSGFLMPIPVYLFFNFFLYGDCFLPFKLGSTFSVINGNLKSKDLAFYLILLLSKENLCILFSLAGFAISIKERSHPKILICLLALSFLIYFSITANKEPRYIISALPYIYLISSYGISRVYYNIAENKYFAGLFIIILFPLLLFQKLSVSSLYWPDKIPVTLFQRYIKANENIIKGAIWISNPEMLVYTNFRPAELIYYPSFDFARAKELQRNLVKADWVFLNTYDFPCRPDTPDCSREKERLLNAVKKKLVQKVYWQDKRNPSLELGVYKRE